MRGRTRDRWMGAGFSLAAHLAILLAMLWAWRATPQPPEPAPTQVALVDLPLAEAPAAAPATKTAATAPAAPAKPAASPLQTPAPAPRPAQDTPPVHDEAIASSALPEAGGGGQAGSGQAGIGVGDADLAGAADAGAGMAGGACDMARRLQNALRRDPLVQAAVAQAATAKGGRGAGRPLLVWDGGWVQSDGEDGKGLAAVREAIAWEVAFAPPACRAQAVRGLILFSLNDSHTARLVLGAAAWRWSDLLALR